MRLLATVDSGIRNHSRPDRRGIGHLLHGELSNGVKKRTVAITVKLGLKNQRRGYSIDDGQRRGDYLCDFRQEELAQQLGHLHAIYHVDGLLAAVVIIQSGQN